MPKQDYSQIMDVLLDIKEDIGRIEQKVDNVHEQASKTNGRVNRLETQTDKNTQFITNYKSQIATLVSVVSVAWIIFGSWIKEKLGL